MCDELGPVRLQLLQKSPEKKSGLSDIIESLKNIQKSYNGRSPATIGNYEEDNNNYDGETTPSSEVDTSPQILHHNNHHHLNSHHHTATSSSSTSSSGAKSAKRRRFERTSLSNNNGAILSAVDYVIHNNNNNNNNVKNERLSPGTPELSSSRSRSVTPSSASHPDTPPSSEVVAQPLPSVTGRNYSDFMRSLAAKYNNTNPNDYFSAARNGFPPPLDPRFKPSSTFPGLLPTSSVTMPINNNKESGDSGSAVRKGDFTSLVNPFANTSMYPPLIDMSTTQTLLAMVRTAKEAEMQTLLRNVKKTEQQPSSPLDLSAAAPRPVKRTKSKSGPGTASNSSSGTTPPKRAQSESPTLHEDISNWSVEDVGNFVSGIDICAEYAENFREQRIDGSGLPLLTEEHLTTTMNMKLGPALKLRAILAKKLGSCSVCLHCTHCHNNNSGSPEPLANSGTGGNTSDSGGPS